MMIKLQIHCTATDMQAIVLEAVRSDFSRIVSSGGQGGTQGPYFESCGGMKGALQNNTVNQVV